MKITELNIRDFRTLEEIDIKFSSSYTAICGKNDSGKTNVVRAIRTLMKEENIFPFFRLKREEELSLTNDFPEMERSGI